MDVCAKSRLDMKGHSGQKETFSVCCTLPCRFSCRFRCPKRQPPKPGGQWLEGRDYLRGRNHLYWSEEDDTYIAEVPVLSGCVADGSTAAEALRNVERIAQEWIETARELGRPVPEPKGRLKYA